MSSGKHNKWLGLLALIPAIAMVFTDQSVLPVALPTIQRHLEATNLQLWWCVNSYLLVSAILVLVGGKLGDRYGHRRVFIWGIALFAVTSAICGFSTSAEWLITARALQGIGAALMIPASSPLIMSLFPQSERGKAVGINISVSSLFLICAPLLGGYLTETASWRWIFWLNLPLAAIGLILVPLFVPRSKKGGQQFDPYGFLFFVLSATCLITWIMQGSQWGWASANSFYLFVATIIGGVLLFWREKNAKHPFIDLSLFKHPIFRAVNISIFATQFVLMISIYRAVYFQNGLDWSPLKSGIISFISALPVVCVSPLGGWLADRFGPKLPISIGFTLLISSFFWLAFFIQGSLEVIMVGLFAYGLGIPLIFTPSYSSAMGSVPPKKSGSAFGVLATVRALSASLGVAIITSSTDRIQESTFRDLVENNRAMDGLDPTFWEGVSSGAKQIQKSFDSNILHTVIEYLKIAQTHAFVDIHIAMGLVLIAAFASVFVLYHRRASHHLPEAPAEGWD